MGSKNLNVEREMSGKLKSCWQQIKADPAAKLQLAITGVLAVFIIIYMAIEKYEKYTECRDMASAFSSECCIDGDTQCKIADAKKEFCKRLKNCKQK